MGHRAGPVWGAAAVGAAVAVVFAGALAVPFHYDDFADIVENPAAQPEQFWHALPGTVRPLLKASYAFGVLVFGPEAVGQHAINVALHLASALLALVLARRLALATPWLAPVAGRFAMAVALVWALHPLATETVTYVSGRSAGLSALLALAALVLATSSSPVMLAKAGIQVVGGNLDSRLRGNDNQKYIAGVLAFLAPLARETALVLPLALGLWLLTIGADRPWRRLMPVVVGALAAAAVIALMPRHRDYLAFSLEARPPLEALRGNIQALPEILSLWLRPWAISIDPARPAEYAWAAWPTLWKAALLLGTAATAMLARRRWPLVAFAIGWTLLWLLPSNSVVWRLDPVSARPLYLASLGPCLLLGLLAATRAGTAATLALAVALGATTVLRNQLYASPVALWRDAVAKAPQHARPHANLGLALLAEGDAAGAAAELRRAVALEPWNLDARRALAILDAGNGGLR